MCTSIAMKTNDFYFGRTMDLEYSFNECVVFTPRNYPVSFRKAGMMKHHYALLGIASIAEICNMPVEGGQGNLLAEWNMNQVSGGEKFFHFICGGALSQKPENQLKRRNHFK